MVGEIQREASWIDGVAGIGHWRTHDHDEVDLISERDDGALIAGVALYLGERSYTFGDRLHVMPVDRLWSV